MELKKEILDYITKITNNHYSGYMLLLEKVAAELGIMTYQAEFDEDISGMIQKNNQTGKYEIFVNRKHPQNRRRFTVAHEIGHYISFLNDSYSKKELETNGSVEDYSMSFRKDGLFSDAETEANLIAATMLMPEDKIKELIVKKFTIEEMAVKFFVSPSSMTIRLQNLYSNLLII